MPRQECTILQQYVCAQEPDSHPHPPQKSRSHKDNCHQVFRVQLRLWTLFSCDGTRLREAVHICLHQRYAQYSSLFFSNPFQSPQQVPRQVSSRVCVQVFQQIQQSMDVTYETQACIIIALGDFAGGFRSFRLFLLRPFAVDQLL